MASPLQPILPRVYGNPMPARAPSTFGGSPLAPALAGYNIPQGIVPISANGGMAGQVATGSILDYSPSSQVAAAPVVDITAPPSTATATPVPDTVTTPIPVTPPPATSVVPNIPAASGPSNITPADISFGGSTPAVGGDPMANFMNYGGNYGATPSFAAPGATAGVPAATGGGWLPEGLAGGLFGKGWGSLQGWGSAIGGIGDLMGAWNGMQQTKLAREQFGFSKAMANRNLANQAAVTNQALRDRRSGRRAVFGGNKGTGAQVSGAPVG